MERQLEIDVKSATVWHLQNLVKNLNMKFLNAVIPELDKVFDQNPANEEYRKDLVKILLKEIDFQGNRQKEAAKINLLKPNLLKIMESRYFLSSIVFELFSGLTDLIDVHSDILRHLKLKISEQLTFCLGIYIFSMQSKEVKSITILKQKLKEWFEFEKDGELPSYAVYALLNAIKNEPELSEDPTFSRNIKEFLIQQNLKSLKEESMQAVKVNSIFDCNRTTSLYKYENDTKNNSDFKFIEKCANTYQVLEPWQVLIDMGPGTSHFEPELLLEVLKDFNKTSLRGLAHTLIAISNHFVSHDNETNLETITMKCNMKGDMTYMNQNPNENPISALQWNIEVLSKALKEVYSGATWIELIKFLDVDVDAREEFYFHSQDSFNIFMGLWNSLKPSNKSFPVEFLIANSWKNKRAQVICLDYAIDYSYQVQDILFEKAKRRQEQLTTLQNIKASTSTYLRIWKCIDLVQTLVNLSDSQHYFRVRNIFETAVKFIPEYILLTLIKIKIKNGKFLMEDLYNHLLPIFLTGHINSIPVLNEVWSTDNNIIINAITGLHQKNPKAMNLSRVLDICQSIKNSLLIIINLTKDYVFGIKLAMIASKRDFLNFDKCFAKMIKAKGDPLVRCILKYVESSLFKQIEERDEDKKIEFAFELSMLTEEKLQMIFENLYLYKDENQEKIEENTLKEIERVFTRIVKAFPSIQLQDHANIDIIEEKGNEFFQQLYKGEKSVEDLVKIMKDFRSSSSSTEREIYA